MTSIDDLWFLAQRADQRAEQASHRLTDRYEPAFERARTETVRRDRFRTLATRIARTGAPYGAHTVVHDEDGSVLLARHEGVDMWVLPGGGVDRDEQFREAARREVHEEVGVEVDYGGLAWLTRVEVTHGEYRTWGVIPVFAGRARSREPTVRDPDGEISAARWFDRLPEDLRERADLRRWLDDRF